MNSIDVSNKLEWLIKSVCLIMIVFVTACNTKNPDVPVPTPPGGRVHEPVTGAFGVEKLLPVQNINHPNAIPGEYIVTFGTQTGSGNKMAITEARAVQARMEARTELLNSGGSVKQEYRSFNGFSAQMSEDMLRELRSNPNVLSIEANVAVALEVDVTSTISNTETALLSWGVDRIDGVMDNSYTSTNNGANINVYVLDSGVDTAHDAFDGRVVNAFDVIEDGNISCGNHGTGVASIIGGENGVANGVMLYSVRALDCNLLGDIAQIISAIEWIGENAEAPAVVNISVATYGSTVYNNVVETLVANGITVVAAAGNDYRFDACDVSPAGAEGVITAGASDENDGIAPFNSMSDGGCINVYAPGVDVDMAKDGNDYMTSSGTSFAAPHVAGCAARYLQTDPTATPADVMAAVESATVDGILTCDFGDKVETTGLIPLDIDNDVPTAVSMSGMAVNTNGIALAFAAFQLLIVTLWVQSRNLQSLVTVHSPV